MKIKDFSEVENQMTEEQKDRALANFRKYYPSETPSILCVSTTEDDEKYLRKVDINDFK